MILSLLSASELAAFLAVLLVLGNIALTIAQSRRGDLPTVIGAMRDLSSRLQEEIGRKDKELEHLKKRVTELETENSKLRGELTTVQEQVKQLQLQVELYKLRQERT